MSADQVLPERRDDRRYHARMAVFYGLYENTLLTDYCINISAGGMFLESSKILPVGTELIVKFKLPDCDSIITTNARVAWTNDPGSIKKASLPPGMGLQFLDLSLDNLHVIRFYLEKGKVNPTW
jgi:uncharacterized protein (TIGR02266 family)